MSIMEGVPKSIARIGRETTMILFVVQSLTSASAIATSTVLSILGEQLSGNAAWSGVSAAMIQMAATPFDYFTGEIGVGLALTGLIVAHIFWQRNKDI